MASFKPIQLPSERKQTLAAMHALTLTGTWCSGNNGRVLIKSCNVNVLKRKAHLHTKFKILCIIMCSLAMSPFSHDFIKWKWSH